MKLPEPRIRTFEHSRSVYRTREVRIDVLEHREAFAGERDSKKLFRWLRSYGIEPKNGFASSLEGASNDVIYSQTERVPDATTQDERQVDP